MEITKLCLFTLIQANYERILFPYGFCSFSICVLFYFTNTFVTLLQLSPVFQHDTRCLNTPGFLRAKSRDFTPHPSPEKRDPKTLLSGDNIHFGSHYHLCTCFGEFVNRFIDEKVTQKQNILKGEFGVVFFIFSFFFFSFFFK